MNFLKDIVKCSKIALFISLGITFLFGIIYYLFFSKSLLILFTFIKNSLYYIGCFGFLISCGFFIKRDANRPLDYEDEWREKFKKLSLSFVILFISFFICLYGMVIQVFLESLLI